MAVINHKAIPETEQIELGNQREPWDARIGGRHIYEVVQALSVEEHRVRLELGAGGLSAPTYLKHSGDHLQFPQAIVDALESKHSKGYSDGRSLVVVFGGDYSGEEDEVIDRWIHYVRARTEKKSFKEILLVELDRLKVFSLFSSNG